MRLDHRGGAGARDLLLREVKRGRGRRVGLSQREHHAESSQERGPETLWWAGRSEGGF